MPKIRGADARQSRTLRQLASIEPEGRTALAAACLVLLGCLNSGRLVVNDRHLDRDTVLATRRMINALSVLQDAICGSSDQITEAFSAFLRESESGVCRG
jgi:hypothetical protein